MNIKSQKKQNEVMEFMRNLVKAEALSIPEVDTTVLDASILALQTTMEASDVEDVKIALKTAIEVKTAQKETLLSADGILLNLIDLYYPETTSGGGIVKMQDGCYKFGITGKAKFDVRVSGSQTHIFRNDDYYMSVSNMSPSRLSHTLVAIGKNTADKPTVVEEDRVVWNIVKNGQIRLERDESLELKVPGNTTLFTVKDQF